ncbi:MAG: hypothetical protein MI749_16140 [Desulfovibrionales bacterium]|nr:hypothetical protein [Desulfovibrionales bacterium]
MFWKRTVARGLCILEAGLLTTLALLEYLSGYRAGVMRHLYFFKIEYMDSLYSSSILPLHATALLLGFVCIVRVSSSMYQRDRHLFRWYYGALVTAFFLCRFLPAIQTLTVAAHLLIAIECIAGLEILRALLIRSTSRTP